jgi:hypothetical protein
LVNSAPPTFDGLTVVFGPGLAATLPEGPSLAVNRHRAKFLKSPMAIHKLQSMGARPSFTSRSLVFEKCLHPKKPLSAEKGEGWAAFRTWCLLVSIRACLSCANLPHNRKTIPFF